ncbi:hypothetical protein JCM10207_002536 [Rhodosporidiobolus poonsookiae]
MAHTELPESCQLYPTMRYAVLPPFQRSPLQPSFYAHDPDTGALVAPLDPTKPFVVYHPDFLKIVGSQPSLKVIASSEGDKEGGYPLFHEAGVWLEETQEVAFTSNCAPQFRNLIGKIRLDALDAPHSRAVDSSWDILTPVPAASSAYPGNTVVASNGATIYRPDGGKDGNDKLLVCCQGTASLPSSLSVVDPQTGESYPILNNFHGRPFSAINDVVVLPPPAPVGEEWYTTDRLDLHSDPLTTIWFTDPTYATAQGYKGAPQMPCQVYCFTPATGDLAGDGSMHPQRPGTIYVYDVVRARPGEKDAQGREVDLTAVQPRLANRRVFAYVDSGIPDGIKTDKEGNVYSGTGEGVSVWNPTGTLLGKIVLFPPSLPSSLPTTRGEHTVRFCANFNLCPGGRMFILAEDRAYVAQLGEGVRGALLP